jgi:hypothetical protein
MPPHMTTPHPRREARLEADGPWYHGSEGGPFDRFSTAETLLTPCIADAAGFAGHRGAIAEVALKNGRVKRLRKGVGDLDKPIADARLKGYRYLDVPSAASGAYNRVSLYPAEDLNPRWVTRVSQLH